MYCSYQYLSIDPRKKLPRPLERLWADHKLQKTLNIYGDFSETITIEKWDLRFKLRSLVRSANLLREYATPTLTPTNRPNL